MRVLSLSMHFDQPIPIVSGRLRLGIRHMASCQMHPWPPRDLSARPKINSTSLIPLPDLFIYTHVPYLAVGFSPTISLYPSLNHSLLADLSLTALSMFHSSIGINCYIYPIEVILAQFRGQCSSVFDISYFPTLFQSHGFNVPLLTVTG